MGSPSFFLDPWLLTSTRTQLANSNWATGVYWVIAVALFAVAIAFLRAIRPCLSLARQAFRQASMNFSSIGSEAVSSWI